MDTKVRVGGVPEHFNLPWHLALENNLFERSGALVEWITYKEGTGAMTNALKNGDVDCCVLLTEGIIADIIKGGTSRIISGFIKTPLIWGVHTGVHNTLNYYGEIFDRQYAISRFGSGSHLMAMVDAYGKDKTLASEQFSVVNNLDTALVSLDKNETDVFYWEKYTTKPYVDEGKLKRIGEYVTPWPCFVIAASEKALDSKSNELDIMLKTIHFVCQQFMRSMDVIDQVSERYHQNGEDVERWFYSTEWSTDRNLSEKMLENVIYTLMKTNITDKIVDTSDLVFPL
ncbi:uracil-DNA glycosylase [Fulvivirga sp. M361]|uniref:uracil-DNA glycosylase n=1 Tax=Fulvivirga sp. M361 TaxID=2594266 RepID=UPI00117AC139|nr:uracil-DNA glycosylase [Fulvivirga sp. M361]TRX61307.1 uracil-DNA glycosylase [Fulvivirga sp. M361]